jgi:hypothetical protein
MHSFAQSLRLLYNDTDVVKHIDEIKKECQRVAPKQQKIDYRITKPSLMIVSQNEFDTMIRNIIYILERQLGFLVDQDTIENQLKLTISWMR